MGNISKVTVVGIGMFVTGIGLVVFGGPFSILGWILLALTVLGFFAMNLGKSRVGGEDAANAPGHDTGGFL